MSHKYKGRSSHATLLLRYTHRLTREKATKDMLAYMALSKYMQHSCYCQAGQNNRTDNCVGSGCQIYGPWGYRYIYLHIRCLRHQQRSRSCFVWRNRLNMEVNLQSLFGLHVTWWRQLCSLAETPQLPPSPSIGLVLGMRYWSAKIDDISLYSNPLVWSDSPKFVSRVRYWSNLCDLNPGSESELTGKQNPGFWPWNDCQDLDHAYIYGIWIMFFYHVSWEPGSCDPSGTGIWMSPNF